MKLIIKTVDIELDNNLRQYIDDKLGVLDRFFKGHHDEAVELRVEVGRPSAHHKKGDVFYAEANLKGPDIFFRATHEDWDLRIAIDRVRDILERDITEYKDKKIDQSRRNKDDVII